MAIDHPFTGYALNAIDAKGRVSVPASLRDVITARCSAFGADGSAKGGALEIGPHLGFDRLQVFDIVGKREIARQLEEGLADLPAAERRQAKADAMGDELGTATTIKYDEAGRMQLPPSLRKVGKLDDLAFFFGVGDYFEIWNPAVARRAWADNPRKLWMIESSLEDRGIVL